MFKRENLPVNIIERFTPCGVNVMGIVRRIIAYVPKDSIADLRAIEILDYAPRREGFACYNQDEKKIVLYIHEIIDWQPRILKKTFIFPYLTIGLALGHEIDHHVNRYARINHESSARVNAMNYVYPSLGIFKPLALMVKFILKHRKRRSG